jgi:predicted unusual protein kinase regulating ubiquinone biosynthesis (AarF/ABC1/UbiB family)
VKLGQLLSTRSDFLPSIYTEALTRLQDRVGPFPYADVVRTIESELGVRMSKAFSEFEQTPIAAASLGQVHRARMRDGRRVAVKVQRPNVREQVLKDLDALGEAAGLLDGHTELGRRYEFQKMLDEFRRSLLRELDYRQEARNLTALERNLAKFERIVVPAPVDSYTTERVLVMDYVRGRKITAITPLAKLEIDGTALAEELFRAYLQQVLVDEFFHADPHPGNVFLTEDGRLALLDLGMTASVPPELQDKLLQLLIAISEGRAEDAASLAIRIGEKREGFDEPELRRRISELISDKVSGTIEQIEVGTIMIELTRISAECNARAPVELTMLGKTLLNLDRIAGVLDPSFDPNAAIRRDAAQLLVSRLERSVSPGMLFSNVIDLKDFVGALPRRLGKILKRVADNDLAIRIDAFDEQRLMAGIQKIANRITLGLILAALIVGAALLMNVPTTWTIFGYPGLAILFFLAAAGGGVALMFNILLNDVRSKD